MSAIPGTRYTFTANPNYQVGSTRPGQDYRGVARWVVETAGALRKALDNGQNNLARASLINHARTAVAEGRSFQHGEVVSVRASKTTPGAFQVEVALNRLANDEVVGTRRVLVPVHGPSLYGNSDLRFRLETPVVKA